jgi:hypothetical protein
VLVDRELGAMAVKELHLLVWRTFAEDWVAVSAERAVSGDAVHHSFTKFL